MRSVFKIRCTILSILSSRNHRRHKKVNRGRKFDGLVYVITVFLFGNRSVAKTSYSVGLLNNRQILLFAVGCRNTLIIEPLPSDCNSISIDIAYFFGSGMWFLLSHYITFTSDCFVVSSRLGFIWSGYGHQLTKALMRF